MKSADHSCIPCGIYINPNPTIQHVKEGLSKVLLELDAREINKYCIQMYS
jgi:hypothetical protein